MRRDEFVEDDFTTGDIWRRTSTWSAFCTHNRCELLCSACHNVHAHQVKRLVACAYSGGQRPRRRASKRTHIIHRRLIDNTKWHRFRSTA
mmetsp:Transcript_26188/g.73066  ORF Transcript_26188/g.73066 Transcript_26188/m.73066 type:complete len:90 (+) Transcript_26188:581-850(+)